MPIRRIARTALAGYFINEAVKTFTSTKAQAAEAASFVEFANRETGGKIPNNPELIVRAQGAIMGCGGAMLALGKLPRVSAALLTPTVGLNAYVHEAFWSEKDPAVKAQKQSNFFRTVAIVGGVLLATVDTAGKPGLVWLASHGVDVSRREATRATKTARREAKLLAATAGSALTS